MSSRSGPPAKRQGGQPVNQPAQQHGMQVHQTTTVSMSPLPLPSDLAAYGQIKSDLVERIVAMAETEGNHRRSQEVHALRAYTRGHLIGQVFGLMIGLGGLTVAGMAVFWGHPWAAGAITAVDLVALVSVFVKGNAPQNQPAKPPEQQLTLPLQ